MRNFIAVCLGLLLALAPIQALSISNAQKHRRTIFLGGNINLLQGLVSYWTLDEASGTRVDSHGSNDLADENTVTQGAGATANTGNSSDHEDANNENLFIADNASLSFTGGSFTVSGWVQFDLLDAAGRAVVSKFSDSPSNEQEWLLLYSFGTDRLQWHISASGATSVSVDADNLGSPSTGVWYFFIVWLNEAQGQMHIQINNGLIDTASHQTGIHQGSAEFLIGGYRSGAVSALDGRVDEVAIWNRVLSTDERTALYNGGNGLIYPF